MTYPEHQEKSGHLHGDSKNKAKKSGSIPDGQPYPGYQQAAGDVNNSRASKTPVLEGDDGRGYRKDSTDSRSTTDTNDGVGKPFKRVG